MISKTGQDYYSSVYPVPFKNIPSICFGAGPLLYLHRILCKKVNGFVPQKIFPQNLFSYNVFQRLLRTTDSVHLMCQLSSEYRRVEHNNSVPKYNLVLASTGIKHFKGNFNHSPHITAQHI